MKKFNLKAFTLVEMLIVIVIIGILIAALLPRMQAAQGRARDVARKTALSQIESAIVTYQGDMGKWPKQDNAASGMTISDDLADILKNVGMTDVPKDPLQGTTISGLGNGSGSDGRYLYMVSTRNGTTNGGFILMAKTEVPGGSNWVVCGSGGGSGVQDGFINTNTDIGTIKPCQAVELTGADGSCTNPNSGTTCYYKELSQLRYIVLY